MEPLARGAPAPAEAIGAPHTGSEEVTAAAADRALIGRAQRGDQAAFRALVERHQARAYGLALRITRSAPDAEEVAQDAFVRAWLALPRFRGESSFATWLYRIVARRAFDRAAALRARGGREADVDEAAALASGGALPRDLETEVRARRLERMVMALPEAQRAAVTLYYYGGHSVERVAETLAMPENTVKTHLSRARAALRKAWLHEGRV